MSKTILNLIRSGLFFYREAFDVLEFCSIKKKKKRKRERENLSILRFGIWSSPETPDLERVTDVVRDKTVGLSRKCSLDSVAQDV